MKKKFLFQSILVPLGSLACFVAAGCGDTSSSKPAKPRAQSNEEPAHHDDHGHAHKPPHGGTPVVIAEHKINLELVRDASEGVMQAFVLDEELEKPIDVPETSFNMTATLPERTDQLQFERTANAAGAGRPEKSSVFAARAEWIKSAGEFEGSIDSITLNGETYSNITFSFPKGTQHIH